MKKYKRTLNELRSRARFSRRETCSVGRSVTEPPPTSRFHTARTHRLNLRLSVSFCLFLLLEASHRIDVVHTIPRPVPGSRSRQSTVTFRHYTFYLESNDQLYTRTSICLCVYMHTAQVQYTRVCMVYSCYVRDSC